MIRIKTRDDYRREVERILKSKNIDISIFVENFNGIRAGPELKKFKEFKEVGNQYQIERAHLSALISHLEGLEKLGYGQKDIRKIQIAADLQKARLTEWIEDKYRIWKLFWKKLRREREIEEKELQRRFRTQK